MGELRLIQNFQEQYNPLLSSSITKGIGDDAAVINRGDFYELISTDMFVEGDHFRRNWSTPEEIGWKTLQATVSDIAAMGGEIESLLISLCLSDQTDAEWVKRMYQGMEESMKGSPLPIIGGDITHGGIVCINITVTGKVEKSQLKLRSYAQPGDSIVVTGPLGGSWAGLEFLRTGQKAPVSEKTKSYCLNKHKKPVAQLKKGKLLLEYCNALIDVSDGLGSEVRHICKESHLGAEVKQELIPLEEAVKEMGKALGKDPYIWAITGGEDFELIFTISQQQKERLAKDHPSFSFWEVGFITDDKDRILLNTAGQKSEMPQGYTHL